MLKKSQRVAKMWEAEKAVKQAKIVKNAEG